LDLNRVLLPAARTTAASPFMASTAWATFPRRAYPETTAPWSA
jgi:hypothetical protein